MFRDVFRFHFYINLLKFLKVEEIKITGFDFISTYIQMLIEGDKFSLKIAEKLDEDPLPIEMIDKLKMMMKGSS